VEVHDPVSVSLWRVGIPSPSEPICNAELREPSGPSGAGLPALRPYAAGNELLGSMLGARSGHAWRISHAGSPTSSSMLFAARCWPPLPSPPHS
jgi:hypothetical protein